MKDSRTETMPSFNSRDKNGSGITNPAFEPEINSKNGKPTDSFDNENAEEVQPKPESFRQMSFKKKMVFIKNLITVEPLIICYIMPSVIGQLAVQNLTLEKACRVNLKYGDDVCSAIFNGTGTNYTAEELEMQTLFTEMNIWKTPIQSAIPAIMILFLGSYSDRHKRRKPFLMMPIIGEFLASLGFILNVVFMKSWPMEAVGVAETVFPALTGGITVMFMALYTYVADISTVETRTLRIGIVHIFITVLFPIGTALSGIIYREIGYYGTFSTSIILYIIGFWYGITKIKEPKQPVSVPKRNFCIDFFDPTHIKDTFSIIYKRRKGSLRVRILLLMLVFIVIIGPGYGEGQLGYLFTRIKFHWNEVNFSLYATYEIVIHIIGSAIAISLLSQYFKVDDLIISTIACVSKIGASFIYAFSKTVVVFCFAPIVGMFSGAGSIAMRSIATKLVTADEVAKIQSLFGVCEAVAPIIYQLLYNFVYMKTINDLPGAYFLLGAALISPSVVIFLVMYYLQLSDLKKRKPEDRHAAVFRYTVPMSEL